MNDIQGNIYRSKTQKYKTLFTVDSMILCDPTLFKRETKRSKEYWNFIVRKKGERVRGKGSQRTDENLPLSNLDLLFSSRSKIHFSI